MTEQSDKMRAIFIEDFGGSDQLKMGSLPIPLPGPDEVQIKISYAAVNPVDWKIREGFLKNRLPHHFPLIPGWDMAGVISALGENVKNFKIGDAVFAYCRKPIIQLGTYAEFICYPAEHVVAKPNCLSFAQSAAFPLAALTVWQALFDSAKLKKDEKILIPAGAGGVGSIAIQIAKEAGATVITTASAANHEYVKSLGADFIIDYHTQSVEQEIKKIAPEGIDVVFDTVGGKALQDSLPLLKTGGRMVSIVETLDSTIAERLKIQADYVFVTANGKQLKQIAELIENKKIRPIEVKEMDLDQAAEAQNQSQQGHVKGKIVLKVQDV